METATAHLGSKQKQERKYKIMNTTVQKKEGRRWTWNSPNGVAKFEIDYILTNRSEIVKDVTIINQVNIGIDFRMVMSNIKLDVEMEKKKKRYPRIDTT